MRYLLQVYRFGQIFGDDRIIFAWVETVGKHLKQERSYHRLRPRQEFPKLFVRHRYSHVTLQLSVFVDGDVLNNHVTLFYFAALEGNVVVYRCRYNSKSRTWGKVNLKDPIHIGDILNYHNNPSNEENVNARLKEPTTATTKQRGRLKK